ncbi:MAG: hypothetical protein PHQ23_01520 [Candidatus Wallbacteria bacterium]|nr:hypothetical protein [Candidatus Wallbacteria bacterium]
MAKSLQISIMVQKDGEEYFAFCPELRSCRSRGITYNQAMDKLKATIRSYITEVHGEIGNVEFHEDLMDPVAPGSDQHYIN